MAYDSIRNMSRGNRGEVIDRGPFVKPEKRRSVSINDEVVVRALFCVLPYRDGL